MTSVDDVEVRIDAYSFVTAPEGPSTIEAICHVLLTAKVEYELGPDDDRATADWNNFDADTLTFRDSVKQGVTLRPAAREAAMRKSCRGKSVSLTLPSQRCGCHAHPVECRL
jgi:hypothetical protein